MRRGSSESSSRLCMASPAVIYAEVVEFAPLICLVGRVRISYAFLVEFAPLKLLHFYFKRVEGRVRASIEFARLLHDQTSGSLCLVALVSSSDML
jgi:hypothetical protein